MLSGFLRDNLFILFSDQTKAELLEGLKVASDSQAAELKKLHKSIENESKSSRCYFQVLETLLLMSHFYQNRSPKFSILKFLK